MSNPNSNMSKLDQITGKHTVSIIIAILFIATLAAFVIMSCVIGELPASLNTLFSTLLVALVGVFGGNNVRK